MSEFRTYETEFTDKECLKAALVEQGYKAEYIEDHEHAQQLFDYQGRATTYVDQTGDKANIIVRRKHVGGAANDLGFIKDAKTGKYKAVISAFDRGKHNDKWMAGLKANYAEKATAKTAVRLNLKPYKSEVRTVNGRKKKVIQYLMH